MPHWVRGNIAQIGVRVTMQGGVVSCVTDWAQRDPTPNCRALTPLADG